MTSSWFFLIAALAAGSAAPGRAATLREARGLVQLRPAGGQTWKPAGALPRTLGAGDALRTGFSAWARLELAGGAEAEAGGNAHLLIEDEGRQPGLAVLFGALEVKTAAGGSARVRAPVGLIQASAASALRVSVAPGGMATVELERGGALVEDNRGRQLLLRPGERVELDLAGLRELAPAPTPAQAKRLDFVGRARRELAFELARDSDFAAAAREARRQEREAGRVLADAEGRRVRVEEFVVRPSASRLVLVTLNGRAEGLSYFSWDGSFDRALPRDLGPVFGGLAGSAAATPWTLSSYAATRSNGRDQLVERGEGGHQVNVNGNVDPLDDAPRIFDAERGRYVSAGAAVFKTLFDRFGLYANGVLKRGWTGANLQSHNDAAPSTVNDPFTGAALGAPLPVVVINSSLPDSSSARRQTLESYGNGSEILREDLPLRGSGGGVSGRSEFGGESAGESLRAAMLSWGLEVRLTASEFGGRPIRLLLSPQGQIVTTVPGVLP